ncbi:uncharacterized protein LOC111055716 [Nilaparvata lugens]|uniref:uncharacterized protein LOC111055716 n=1 Tax=Nilaparvata lugens TaxID=108931 RepID=UPI00193CB716|nr:uncharacterized protein LOC111055716 [Nilaparvata lugens]
MIPKMVTHILIWLLAASLSRTHEEVDVPLTQIYGGPPSGSGVGLYPYPGVKSIGGCSYPPGVSAGHNVIGPYGGGIHPNYPPHGGVIGEVMVPVNQQYPFPYYSQPGASQYINGPNIQYGTNTQHTGGPYHIPPCTKTLLETNTDADKSRAALSQTDFIQPAFRVADEQVQNPAESMLGGLYLAPYKSNCDNNAGRSNDNEDTVPLQLFETRSSADSGPILTAVPLHFNHGLNNYFHKFGFTKPLPKGGLIYSNTFSNHLHSNFH